MKRYDLLFAMAFAVPIISAACDTSYTPQDVPCSDMNCGTGEICYAYTNSCLAPEYSCVTSHDGCVVSEHEDAAAFEQCIGVGYGCTFDPETEVLSCRDEGDEGC